MFFGFLMLDILLWGILPFILLLLLWGDKKFWAATLTVIGVGLFAFADWAVLKSNIASPVWIGNLIKYVGLYAGVGLGFSFLKWKVLASQTARGFEAFLQKWDMNIDVNDVEKTVKRSRATGGVDSFSSDYEDALIEAKAQAIARQRDNAAEKWNNDFNNKYRAVLRVVPKTGSGWATSYNKIELAQYITSWIAYWPFYLVLLVIDDLIRFIADWVVAVFGKGYQKMADASFSDIK